MKITHVQKGGILILAIILATLAFPGCGGGGIELPDIKDIADIKGDNWQDFVGQSVTVEGVFVTDPVPMIVTDPDALLRNMQLPLTSYILLSGDQVANMNPEENGGAKLQLDGVVREVGQPELYPDDKVDIVVAKWSVINKDFIYKLHIIDFELLPFLLEDRYAVLFSGGINAGNNHTRYWNDLKFMYSTLINKYGFTDDTIYVLYANGTGKDADMTVDFSATQANLESVFDTLKGISDKNDKIFVFMTNHGGGFFAADPHPHWYGGQRDTGADEGAESISEATFGIDFDGDGTANDTVTWDEELHAWGGHIYDDAFVDMFNEDLDYKELVVVMEQCFSAGLIFDMAQGGDGRVLMAAAGQLEPSWAMPPDYTYDEFSYWFTSAINWAEPDGTAVDADTNDDESVSMVEAFNFARSNDTRPETPWYEDSGEGAPHSGAMPFGGDGAFGADVNLD